LDHDTVTLAHLTARAAHVIETPGTILRRRHEGALRLRRG
jgi:hypothetical protein